MSGSDRILIIIGSGILMLSAGGLIEHARGAPYPFAAQWALALCGMVIAAVLTMRDDA